MKRTVSLRCRLSPLVRRFCTMAKQEQPKPKPPPADPSHSYRPVLLPNRARNLFADDSGLSVGAMCDRIAHDRVYVTAKISTDRHFMYTDSGGGGGGGGGQTSGKSYLLPDTEASLDPTRLVTLEVSDLRESIEKKKENPNHTASSSTSSCNRDGGDHEYVYFTSPLKDVAPTYYHREACKMWKDLDMSPPFLPLHDNNDAPAASPPPEEEPTEHDEPPPPLSVWMGGTGVVTQAHYDTDDNVFVQVSGSKRFVFYAPGRSVELRLYPDCHPRARKSQIDFDRQRECRDTDCDSDGNTDSGGDGDGDGNLPAWNERLPEPDLEVVLRPGDCLYIPAFWFHHVETLSPSVSINAFVQSPVWTRAERILGLATPVDYTSSSSSSSSSTNDDGALRQPQPNSEIENKIDKQQEEEELRAIRVMCAWIETLLPELGYPAPREFVGQLVESRFDSLSSNADYRDDDDDDDDWDTLDDWDRTDWNDDDDDNNNNGESLSSATATATAMIGAVAIACPRDIVHEPIFRECLQRYTEEFFALEALDGGPQARDLVVSHLLELWAVRVVGPHRAGDTLRLYSEGFSWQP